MGFRYSHKATIATLRIISPFIRKITSMQTGFFTHDLCLSAKGSTDSPESPERLKKMESVLEVSGLTKRLLTVESEKASDEDILLVHEKAYLDKLKTLAKVSARLSEETTVTDELLEAAYKNVGAAIKAVSAVLNHDVKNAFVCARPPGHHAGRNFGEGFCLMNTVAVAARYAIKHCDVKRIAIFDIDAHRANGTADIFANDSCVALFDSFQVSAFPFDAPVTAKNIHLMPLEEGATGKDYITRFESEWIDPLKDFAPELILVSFGFDTHYADTQTLLKFSEFDYAFITRLIMRLARELCEGHLVSFLEGGYDARTLPRSVFAHISTLTEDSV